MEEIDGSKELGEATAQMVDTTTGAGLGRRAVHQSIASWLVPSPAKAVTQLATNERSILDLQSSDPRAGVIGPDSVDPQMTDAQLTQLSGQGHWLINVDN